MNYTSRVLSASLLAIVVAICRFGFDIPTSYGHEISFEENQSRHFLSAVQVSDAADNAPIPIAAPPLARIAQAKAGPGAAAIPPPGKKDEQEAVWKSEDLSLLAVGLGVGDLDGDGKNEIVIIDPSTVYVYRFSPEGMSLLAEYSARPLELKSVDVAKLRPDGPCRIYVTAQNRGAVNSFVLEYRNGALVPVIQEFDYYLRIIQYPTKGPILLGQRKGIQRIYDGPIYTLVDKGDSLEVQQRFGVPLKIPIFGFAIGDLEGKLKPLIAMYDREDHLRVYQPDGKKLFVSKDFYGGSDVILRAGGPEVKEDNPRFDAETPREYCRPRMLSVDLYGDSKYELLAISHTSKTMRVLNRTKMLEEGQVIALTWNGDVFVEKWTTPKIQGMVTDFTLNTLPGLSGMRLITLERKKTDWLAFLKSKSQVRAYNLHQLMNEGKTRKSDD